MLAPAPFDWTGKNPHRGLLGWIFGPRIKEVGDVHELSGRFVAVALFTNDTYGIVSATRSMHGFGWYEIDRIRSRKRWVNRDVAQAIEMPVIVRAQEKELEHSVVHRADFDDEVAYRVILSEAMGGPNPDTVEELWC